MRNQFSSPQILLQKHERRRGLGGATCRGGRAPGSALTPGTYLSITSDSLTIWAMSPFWIFCCDSRSWALVHLGKGSRVSSLGHAVRSRELPAPTSGTSVQGNQTRARDPAPPLPCLKARTTRTASPPFSSRSCSFCFLSSDSNYLPAGCDRHNQVSVCHTPKKC